ncbi:unnamed protein product, partial [Meganyctiphanes norvegica]
MHSASFGQSNLVERQITGATSSSLETHAAAVLPCTVGATCIRAASTVVSVHTIPKKISGINPDNKIEQSVQLTFRQLWTDERLVFDDSEGRIKYLSLSEKDKIWTPDLFFKNEKKGHFHNIIEPNMYIRIFPGGQVLYSTRVSLTLSCPMDLKLYPMDKQECKILVASYGKTADDLALLWKEHDPVQITRNLHLPRFSLQRFTTDYCNTKTNTGEYSCLVVNMVYTREFSYYFLTIYVPCCMLVIVSWMSFWLDRNALSARIILVGISLSLMFWLAAGINQSLPPVSYTKAIDVWTGCCMTFVFFALCEIALVNFLSPSRGKNQEPKGDPEIGKSPAMVFSREFLLSGRGVDIVSRMLFPLVFVLFQVMYWATYIPASAS